jgi:hypothetical protein
MSNKLKVTDKDTASEKSTKTSLFDKHNSLILNDYHTYLAKKVERLTSALYVITGFLHQDEPVRNKLRKSALDIVTASSHPRNFSSESVELFRAKCAEIGTILEAAKSARLISVMNADLLTAEYAALAAFVDKHAGEIGTGAGEETRVSLQVSIGQKDKLEESSLGRKKKKLSDTVQGFNKGHADRRSLVLRLLHKQDRISIKDALYAIGGSVSEKTVQRVLLGLVRDGVLVKEGERRWSTYRKADISPVEEGVSVGQERESSAI